MRATYLAYCLLRELNHRLTGVSRQASPVTTFFVTGVLLSAASPVLRPFRRMRPQRPSLLAAGTLVAVGRHLTSVVGGEPLRDTPHANSLIALGFVAPALELIALPVELGRAAGAGAARAWRRMLAIAARERTA